MDKIREILSNLDKQRAEAVASGNAKNLGNYDESIKQIRQQVGRELLDDTMLQLLPASTVRRICQLEE